MRQFNVTPSERFWKAWDEYEASHTFKTRDMFCAAVLWIMGLPPDEKQKWLARYLQWEREEDQPIPATTGGASGKVGPGQEVSEKKTKPPASPKAAKSSAV